MTDQTPTLEEVWATSKSHIESDEKFQERVLKQFERMEPMIVAFEKNKIKKMVFEEETNTLYIYSKRIITIAGAAAVLWAVFQKLR